MANCANCKKPQDDHVKVTVQVPVSHHPDDPLIDIPAHFDDVDVCPTSVFKAEETHPERRFDDPQIVAPAPDVELLPKTDTDGA